MSGFNVTGSNYNFNIQGAGPKKVQANEVEKQAVEKQVKPQSKNVSADEVLSFLGGQSSAKIEKREKQPTEAISSKRKIEISKFIDAEAAKRIAASVFAFSGSIENIKDHLNAEDSEFKGLSDNSKTNLALATFNKEFLS